MSLATESRRIYGLDILRAYSILTVVAAHGLEWIGAYVNQTLYVAPLADGVTIFFVLSGFLIGNIILRMVDTGRTSGADLLNFLKRRWLRTIPNYVLVLSVLILLTQDVPHGALYYVFLQNFADPMPAFFPESWSLPVEEWFYLLFPLLLFAMLPFVRGPKAAVSCIALFVLGPALLRLYRVDLLGPYDLATWTANVKMQVLTRLDSIAWGVAAALVLKRFPNFPAGGRLLCLALGVVLFLFDKVQLYGVQSEGYIANFTLLVATLAAVLTLPYLSTVAAGQGLLFRFVTFTSKISYAMYLVHFSLIAHIMVPAISNALGWNNDLPGNFAAYFLYWALAYGLAAAVYRLYERPILQFRDRLYPDGTHRQLDLTGHQPAHLTK